MLYTDQVGLAAPWWLAAVPLRNPASFMFADEALAELKTSWAQHFIYYLQIKEDCAGEPTR